MPNIGVSKALFLREVRDYVMIFIAMMSYCIGWTVFLLPNNIIINQQKNKNNESSINERFSPRERREKGC